MSKLSKEREKSGEEMEKLDMILRSAEANCSYYNFN